MLSRWRCDTLEALQPQGAKEQGCFGSGWGNDDVVGYSVEYAVYLYER